MNTIQQLITDHIDIWTAADTEKKLVRGRTSSNAASAYGIKKLRELILDLAVRGKLVPQNPNDEPASELLERIQIEKNKLITEGKIKKDKPPSAITEKEKPFALPKGWVMARLQEVFDVRDGTHDTPKYCDSGFPLITSKNLYSGVLDFSNIKYISENDHFKIKQRSGVERGDILFAMIGSIGNPVIVETDADFSIKNVALFKPYSNLLCDMHYLLKYLLMASTNMREQATGAVQSFVSLGIIRNYIFPMPPLAEQQRIVAKVDELMALCDQLETQHNNTTEAHEKLVSHLLSTLTQSQNANVFSENWQRIAAHFDILFTTETSIDALKKILLQLAMMGKLVPQDSNDEPANELLKRIQTEKSKLITQGKIKESKSLGLASEDKKLFALPQGWEWSSFPGVGELARGKSKHRPRNDPKLYTDGSIPLVQTGDVARADGYVTTYTALYNKNGLEQSRLWPAGTMCITIAANIADSAILKFDACFPDSVVGFIPFLTEIDVRFYEFFLRTAKSHLEDFAPSTAQKNINLEILSNVFIPVPPVNEIHRIVTKIDELMALCNQLKIRITETNHLQQKLADVMVEQAVMQ